MKQQTIVTTRFLLGQGFYVDALATGDTVEFWMGCRRAEVKELMFAASLELMPPDRWASLVEENVEEYVQDFTKAWLEE